VATLTRELRAGAAARLQVALVLVRRQARAAVRPEARGEQALALVLPRVARERSRVARQVLTRHERVARAMKARDVAGDALPVATPAHLAAASGRHARGVADGGIGAAARLQLVAAEW